MFIITDSEPIKPPALFRNANACEEAALITGEAFGPSEHTARRAPAAGAGACSVASQSNSFVVSRMKAVRRDSLALAGKSSGAQRFKTAAFASLLSYIKESVP